MLPLEAVSWEVEVAGPLAEVVVRQRFVNASARFVDATYLFPLEPDAVVDRMVLRIGRRVIRSEIAGRDEARATYEAAANAGKVAALLSEQQSDVYAQEVSNIPPWSSIEVELSLVQPAHRVGAEWELVLPLVVAPRFEVLDRLADSDAILDGSLDPVRDQPGVPVDIRAAIHAGTDLREITSPTHPGDAEIDGHEGSLAVWNAVPDRDFVLRWSSLTGPEPTLSLLLGDEHALLEIEPPELAFAPFDARDVVFVIEPALALDLQETALLAQASTSDPAVTVDSLEAAYAVPLSKHRDRTIAYVGTGHFAESSLSAVRADPRIALVALGIGPAPNRTLLAELARRGGGVAVFTPSEFAAALAPPLLTEVTVDWARCPADHPLPSGAAEVRAGLPLRFLARVPACSGPVWVSAHQNGRRVEWPVWAEYVPPHRALAVAWARARVDQLERSPGTAAEIRDIGLRWGIVTSETSLVAVDDRVQNLTGERHPAVQPLQVSGTVLTREFLQRIPAGRSYQAVVQTAAGVSYAVDGANTRDDAWPVGTNHLEVAAEAWGQTANGGREAGAEAAIGGPVVTDRAWLTGAIRGADLALDDPRIATWSLQGTARLQPEGDHRFDLAGATSGGASAILWERQRGLATWRWAPEAATLAVNGALDRREVDVASRTRAGVGLAVEDRLGDHALAADVGWARTDWRTDRADRASISVRDEVQFHRGHVLAAAGVLGLTPRGELDVRWEPTRALALGLLAHRTVDADRLLPERITSAAAPTTEEVRLHAEVGRELTLGARAGVRHERFAFAPAPDALLLPPGPVPTVTRWLPAFQAELAYAAAARGSFSFAWTRRPGSASSALLLDAAAPFVPGFLSGFRPHALDLAAQWDLPSDPWTLALFGEAHWGAAIPSDAAAWWLKPTASLSGGARQDLPLRGGHLEIRLEATYSLRDPASTKVPLEVLLEDPAAPSLDALPPAWLGLSIGYRSGSAGP